MRNLIAKVLYRLVGNLVKQGQVLCYVEQVNRELISAGCEPLDSTTTRVVEKWQSQLWDGTVSMRRGNA